MSRTSLVPAVFFLSGSLLILILAYSQLDVSNERIRLETEVTSEQISLRLQACFNSRAALVETLSSLEWQSREQLISTWQERASTLYPLHSGILGLNFVDKDWIITKVYPQASNAAALNINLHDNPNPSVIQAIGEAETSTSLVRTDSIELLQTGTGITLYKRIESPSGETIGFANGVFRLDSLLQSCLSEAALRDRFVFRLIETSGLIFYQYPERNASLYPSFSKTSQLDILGKDLRFVFSPSDRYLQQTKNTIEVIWVLFGLILITTLTLVIRALMLKHEVLKASQEKYKFLVENQTDMLVQVNENFEFQYVSPSYCRMFGKQEAELLNHSFLPLVHEDDRELTSASLACLSKAPHTSYHEQRAMTPKGWRWLAWSNTATLKADGSIDSISAVGRDITERKNLEARMAHSQKMQALGNMAGGISHDFNNLLQVILGNIEFLIIENNNNLGLTTQLNKIREAVERATSLIGRLSTLGRQDVTQPKTIELNPFLEELITLIKRTIPSSIDITFIPSPTAIFVEADPTQLEQVLLNICFNARDAITSNGKIELKLSQKLLNLGIEPIAGKLSYTNYACISISDNGCGIAADLQPRIFDPFFTTKKKGSGTGLGLANSYSIIKNTNGDILLESTENIGSMFTICLPTTKSSNNTQDSIEKQSETQNDPSPAQQSLILVVDDDKDILNLTCAILEQSGFKTISATNGLEAIAKVDAYGNQLALIIMDIMMPLLGGREAAEEIQKKHSNIKILFMSGFIPPKEEELKNSLLKKPFTRAQLLQTVASQV